MIIQPRLDRETTSDYAYRTIKENIISLELLPGASISEVEIASQLGVSRTPVRESFIKLSKTGVMEIYPQRGSIVSLIDEKMVDESCFLRRVLEEAMIDIICSSLSEEDLLPLIENVNRQEFYFKHNDNQHLLELDNEFHKLLFLLCHKENSYNMLSEFSIHFDRVRNLALTVEGRENIIEDHKALLDAILNKEVEKAKSILGEHLSRYKGDLVIMKEKCPRYFK